MIPYGCGPKPEQSLGSITLLCGILIRPWSLDLGSKPSHKLWVLATRLVIQVSATDRAWQIYLAVKRNLGCMALPWKQPEHGPLAQDLFHGILGTQGAETPGEWEKISMELP